MQLPPDFTRKMGLIFGREGLDWAESFPETYAACIDRWSLAEIDPVEDLSINFVARAKLPDGTGVVLKAGVPNKEFWSEAEALRIINGDGYIRLLEYDEDLSAMLLEEAIPGSPLAEIADDDEATTTAARLLMASQHELPPSHSLPHVSEWTDGLKKLRPFFDGGTGPFPEQLADLAIDLFEELHDQSDDEVIIHGDYHHWNILRGERAPWLIIDPKGLVGPLGYEIGQFIHNFPDQTLGLEAKGRLMSRRIDIFSSILEIPRSILLKWGVAQSVLSAWWCVEDGGSYGAAIEHAEVLAGYLTREI